MNTKYVLPFAVFSVAACSAGAPGDPMPGIESKISQKVVNGTPSPSSQDAVVVVVTPNMMCSGTLITPNLVLTARHCVAQRVGSDGSILGGDLPGSEFKIATGADAGPNGPNFVAHGQQVYDDGSTTIVSHDVALIQLDRDVASVPTAGVRQAPTSAGELVTVVGYGEDGNGQLTKGRYERTGIAILGLGPTQLTFTSKDGQQQPVDVPSGTICTGESACHGDSGGPIFDAQGNVVGVVSGPGGTEDTCIDAPAFFSDVASHFAFISQTATAAGHPLPVPLVDAGSGNAANAAAGDDGGAGNAGGGAAEAGDGRDAGITPPSDNTGHDAGATPAAAAPSPNDSGGGPSSGGCSASPARSGSSWGLALVVAALVGARRRRPTA